MGLYTLHSLTEADISQWTQFCASCFSYKPNPPPASYFGRHFYNDPRKDANLIRVMKYNEDIVASTRVFSRLISLGEGRSCEAGGIGEVCTHPDHRRKGLAKQLLHNAIGAMRSRSSPQMQYSLLHASPSLTQVYEKSANYRAVTSHWSVLPVHVDSVLMPKFGLEGTTLHVRLASFPDDTLSLQKQHQDYSERRFAGCVIRSIEYWNDYLSKDIGDSLYVLVSHEENKIVAWMSIRQRSETRLQLREFGCTRLAIQTIRAFPILLHHILSEKQQQLSTSNTDTSTLEVHVPTEVLNEMKEEGLDESVEWVNWSTGITEENDVGWMYKTLHEETTNANAQHDDRDMHFILEEEKIPHLIWPSDSF